MAGEILECIYRDGMAYVSFTEYQRVVEKNLADLKYAKDWKELCNKTKDELESLKIGLEQARGDRNRVFEEKMKLKEECAQLRADAVQDCAADYSVRKECDALRTELLELRKEQNAIVVRHGEEKEKLWQLLSVQSDEVFRPQYIKLLQAMAQIHNAIPRHLRGPDQ